MSNEAVSITSSQEPLLSQNTTSIDQIEICKKKKEHHKNLFEAQVLKFDEINKAKISEKKHSTSSVIDRAKAQEIKLYLQGRIQSTASNSSKKYNLKSRNFNIVFVEGNEVLFRNALTEN